MQKIATEKPDLCRFLRKHAKWSDLVKKDPKYAIDARMVNAYRASMTQRVLGGVGGEIGC